MMRVVAKRVLRFRVALIEAFVGDMEAAQTVQGLYIGQRNDGLALQGLYVECAEAV